VTTNQPFDLTLFYLAFRQFIFYQQANHPVTSASVSLLFVCN